METKYAKSFKILTQVEYSNKPDLFLHKNKNEPFFTIGGIYEKYHKVIDWHFIHKILNACDGNLKRASEMLYNDRQTRMSVFAFFKKNFWDISSLDEVQSQIMCNEIFLSSVHIGVVNAVKLAQRVIGVKDDGIVGKITIRALNAFNEQIFDTKFDQEEMKYYKKVIKRNPELRYAEVGFENRAYKV